jgi:hypothetical protein
MPELSIIESVYRLYKKLTIINSKFPKTHRYCLGERTLSLVLDTAESLITAKNAPRTLKLPHLLVANTKLEILKLHLRIYLSEKLANETTIFQINAIVSDAGRQLGGWIKSLK